MTLRRVLLNFFHAGFGLFAVICAIGAYGDGMVLRPFMYCLVAGLQVACLVENNRD